MKYINNEFHKDAKEKTGIEYSKEPKRYDVINHIINYLNKDVRYFSTNARALRGNVGTTLFLA
jgi:hypothetical protein